MVKIIERTIREHQQMINSRCSPLPTVNVGGHSKRLRRRVGPAPFFYFHLPRHRFLFTSASQPRDDLQLSKVVQRAFHVMHAVADAATYIMKRMMKPVVIQLEGLVTRIPGAWRIIDSELDPSATWTAKGLKPHPLFEAAWYSDFYHDVAESGMNPLVHYLKTGGPAGRFPNPFFDGGWYLQQAPPLPAGSNPLVHYVNHGAAQGRWPSPHFDPDYYRKHTPALRNREMDALTHFILYGWGRNRRNALDEAQDPFRVKKDLSYDQIAAFTRPDLAELLNAEGIPSELFDFASEGKEAWDEMGKATLREMLDSATPFEFPKTDRPLVSFVLVLLNNAHLTLLCLASILTYCDLPYEVIVVDNHSTDDTNGLLDLLVGVKLVKNDKNLGFGFACMQAAHLAAADYLCFLNNDALLQPSTIRAALANFKTGRKVGAVGGKVLFPDGRLQEAGSMLWTDGTAWGYGRGENPGASQFNFRRPVDYCSGVFLLTPHSLFLNLGGFDPQFFPAYYEDTDYCLSLWAAGYEVVYEPRAVVLHYESASSDTSEVAKGLIASNRDKFVAKWRGLLTTKYFRMSENVLSARLAIRDPALRVLFLSTQPHNAQNTPPHAHLQLISMLVAEGHHVTWLSLGDESEQGVPVEVELLRPGNGFRSLFREHLPHCDVLWIGNLEACDGALREGLTNISGHSPAVVCPANYYEPRAGASAP